MIFFDDAAHIGREAGLEEFFDIYKTLANSNVSCKAAIYPGVTRFGTRFDVYNDASIVEISRREDQRCFGDFFYSVMESRFKLQMGEISTTKETDYHIIAKFLGSAVIGNVRSFVRACSFMFELGGNIGFQTLTGTFLKLSREFYWPMLDEVKFKLGVYEVMIEPSEQLVDYIYQACGNKGAISCIVHRNLVNRLSKPFEILEYAGFISRREASRAMKSGGRGTRYVMNLCNMLEYVPGSRLSKELIDKWDNREVEDVQFSQGSGLAEIELPILEDQQGLEILDFPIEKLKKSNVFPYGLTDNKLELLKGHNLISVGDLAEVSDAELLKIEGIGKKTVERFRNVLGQAIWM